MRLGFFRPYRVHPDFLDAGDLDEVQREIVDSPYLGQTTLNQRFGETLGFSVTFTRAGLPSVQRQWPAIASHLTRILDSRCNAFFLNPLVIAQGCHVDAHIDCSLRSWTAPEDPPFPVKVTVLYVQIPAEVQGGQLLLYPMSWGIPKAVVPRRNLLVEFLGSLRHEVSPVLSDVPQSLPRISLVCEQYRMPRDLLALIPAFHLNSKRSFEEFLEKALEMPSSGNDGVH